MTAPRCIFAGLKALAVASNADDSSANLNLILLGLALVAGAALLAGGLGLAARARRHRQLDLLVGALVLWAVVSVGSGLWYAEARTDWAEQRLIRVESGYGADSNSIDADAPRVPIALWSGLAVTYLLLAGWTLVPGSRRVELA